MVQKIIILQTVGTNNVVTMTVKIFVDLVKPGEVLDGPRRKREHLGPTNSSEWEQFPISFFFLLWDTN